MKAEKWNLTICIAVNGEHNTYGDLALDHTMSNNKLDLSLCYTYRPTQVLDATRVVSNPDFFQQKSDYGNAKKNQVV